MVSANERFHGPSGIRREMQPERGPNRHRCRVAWEASSAVSLRFMRINNDNRTHSLIIFIVRRSQRLSLAPLETHTADEDNPAVVVTGD